jgi:hypothetical protein
MIVGGINSGFRAVLAGLLLLSVLAGCAEAPPPDAEGPEARNPIVVLTKRALNYSGELFLDACYGQAGPFPSSCVGPTADNEVYIFNFEPDIDHYDLNLTWTASSQLDRELSLEVYPLNTTSCRRPANYCFDDYPHPLVRGTSPLRLNSTSLEKDGADHIWIYVRPVDPAPPNPGGFAASAKTEFSVNGTLWIRTLIQP